VVEEIIKFQVEYASCRQPVLKIPTRFQWVFLALVGDRKRIQPQKFCTNYNSWYVATGTVLFLAPFLFLHCHPSPCLRRTWLDHGDGMVLKRMYGEGEGTG